ncbi:hypothetical protein C8R47DRAFT_1206510 [Mycena vitilis]|nr:hypothetical protein C8R47DRAFT_1231409 [Mycena vitilis]KAJ6515174.1 hypothetical protein C8R47DRAFT_1206510 [Mycena vitilis]
MTSALILSLNSGFTPPVDVQSPAVVDPAAVPSVVADTVTVASVEVTGASVAVTRASVEDTTVASVVEDTTVVSASVVVDTTPVSGGSAGIGVSPDASVVREASPPSALGSGFPSGPYPSYHGKVGIDLRDSLCRLTVRGRDAETCAFAEIKNGTNLDKAHWLFLPPTIAPPMPASTRSSPLKLRHRSARNALRRSWLRAVGPPPLGPPLPVVGWGTGGGWGGGGWGHFADDSLGSLPSTWGSADNSNGGWGEAVWGTTAATSNANLPEPPAAPASLDPDAGAGGTDTNRLSDGECVERAWHRLDSGPPPQRRDIRCWADIGADIPEGVQEAWTRFFSTPPASPPQAKWDSPAWDSPGWDDYVRWMSKSSDVT